MAATRVLLALLSLLAAAAAFAPGTPRAASVARRARTAAPPTVLFIDLGEPERKALTRESEPDEFFSTNTDKMTDQEKIPIAIMGLVGISTPFILGLIALYAAK